MDLDNLECILNNKKSIKYLTENYGIYFLIYDKEIVYIGKSKRDVFERIRTHYKTGCIIFDSFFILNCDKKNCDKLEAEYIFKYTPKYNKIINTKDSDIVYKGLSKTGLLESNINNITVIINNKIYMKGIN